MFNKFKLTIYEEASAPYPWDSIHLPAEAICSLEKENSMNSMLSIQGSKHYVYF